MMRQIATRNACVSGSCCRRQKARAMMGAEGDTGKDGGSSKVYHDLAWRRS